MLSARDIGFVYAQGTSFATVALERVDADLEPGRLLLIAGATGSGKSTLLRVLAGLARPSSGAVEIAGAAPEPASREPERRVGILFQRPESQLFSETVLDDVAFGPRNLGIAPEEARARARTALERVGCDPEEFGDRSPFLLSGGEERRVALAGVLALEPRYLFLDEPTAGLDAEGREAVRHAVRAAREECGVAVVSHDLEELLDLADDVLVLDAGRVAFAGTVEAFVLAGAGGAEGVPVPETVAVQAACLDAGLELDAVHADPEAAADTLARALEAAGRWRP